MADRIPSIHADRGSAGIGENYGPVTFNNHFLIQSGLTEQTIQDRETQYLRRVIGDCGGLEWLTLMNLEEGDSSMGLDVAYTALLTETHRERELTEIGKMEPALLADFW